MFTQVTVFLEKNKILYEYQFGFEKNTINTLGKRALDTGKYVFGVFLDLKKTFDNIDHGILPTPLESYGIQRNILNWFKIYLSDRSKYVEYNSSMSERKHIILSWCTTGIHFGSLIIYIAY